MNPRFLAAIGTAIVLSAGSSRVFADETYLSAEELKVLIPGATVETKDDRGGTMEVTYKGDGTYSGHIDRNKRIYIKGQWAVLQSDNGGVFCHREWCSKIAKDGDGYALYNIYGNRRDEPFLIEK